ncbi:MAG: serine protein kinase PrkA [Planctomycetota bacterium]
MDPTDQLAERVRGDFEKQGRVLSFWKFLDEVRAQPAALMRSSAQYVRDMFDHFGHDHVEHLGERVVRHKLFNGVPGDAECQRVVGQELATDAIYRVVRRFAREGRDHKLVLMHGPNGSSKTSIADLMFKGLEAYSHTPVGALYRFSWVFPKGGGTGAGLGFGTSAQSNGGSSESFAHLGPTETSAVVQSDMKTNPVFLIPREFREEWLQEICGGELDFPHLHIVRGDLGAKSREIYEALLTSHKGDWREVMRYIRVERFYISRRYRAGAVSIEPQASVDAEAHQVTADASMANLPPALQNLRLFEVGGDLIDANRGLVEYSDFLKRPLEFNKYLLTTTEKCTVRLSGTLAYLDLVMVGSANEKHLDGFKTDPNFTSFKGRMELVHVPYLLEYEREVEIYRDQLDLIALRKEIAPHAARAAALWAVLTRLWKPDPAQYPENERKLIAQLTPLAKALLYQGRDPGELERYSADEVRVLRARIPELAGEYRDSVVYEGRFGASPREMKMILAAASSREDSKCFTPIAVLEELRALVRDKTIYDFLKLEPKGGFNDPVRFVDDVERAVVRVVMREMKDAMALVDEDEYDRRFDEYFQHAIAYTRGKTVTSPVSGEEREPDPRVLNSVESLIPTGDDIDLFRQNLIAKIGAYSVANPGGKLNFRELFPDILRSLKKDFYARQSEAITQVQADLIKVGTPEFDRLDEENRDQVERTLKNLEERHGYTRQCALELLPWAIKKALPEDQGG